MKIVLLHTVRSVMEPFIARMRAALPDCTFYNMLDEYLAMNATEEGCFTSRNKGRLYALLREAAATGADLIVSSCSTLSPHLAAMRPLFDIPIVTVDDEMARAAAEMGEHTVAVLATAQSAIGPVRDKILVNAETMGRHPEVREIFVPGAIDALNGGDRETHDRLLLEAARPLRGKQEVIVLAQASMAHVDRAIADLCGCPVLTSPASCVRQTCALVEQIRQRAQA